jgi:uncharacterized protein YidB (DUF937 family)
MFGYGSTQRLRSDAGGASNTDGWLDKKLSGDILEPGGIGKGFELEDLNGVGDGSRTRDFLSHSQALYP